MSKSEIVSKIVEILKAVDEKDYYCMVSAFGSEEVCKKYIQDSLKHPDMIINLLQGARRKSENKTIKGQYTYTVAEDVDTKDNTPIYTVKINGSLSRDEYLQVSKYMKEFGGYYSRFKHAFIFREDPSES